MIKAKLILLIFSLIITLSRPCDVGICSEKQPGHEKTIVFGTIFPESVSYFHNISLIYSEAFKRLGYQFKLVSLPGERSLVDANSGVVDGEASRIANLDLDEYPNLIRVFEPIIVFKDGAYSTDLSIRINGWESLRGKGYKVGFYKGIKSVEQKLPQYVKKGNIITLTGFEQSLRMLQARRIDLLISSTLLEESALMKSDEFKDIKRVGIVEDKVAYPWLHKRHRSLAPRLADEMKAMKADGTFQALAEKAKNR
jgi:ABC-type amino acid transport substrate-binding protein